jgi:hypothetical protein
MNIRPFNASAVRKSLSLAAFLPAIALGTSSLIPGNGYGLASSQQHLSDRDAIAPIVSVRGEESEQCQWLGVCE